MMGTLPPAIQALTGVDLTGVRIDSFLCFLFKVKIEANIYNDTNGLDVTSKLESSTLSPQFDNGSGPGLLDQRARPRTALSSQSKPVGDELAWSSISLTSSPSPHSVHATSLSVGPLHLH